MPIPSPTLHPETTATGTLRGPRQRCPPPPAIQWDQVRPGHPGSRICRSTSAQARQSLDPSNRRISHIVQYIVKNNDEEETKSSPGNKEKKPDEKTSPPPQTKPGKTP